MLQIVHRAKQKTLSLPSYLSTKIVTHKTISGAQFRGTLRYQTSDFLIFHFILSSIDWFKMKKKDGTISLIRSFEDTLASAHLKTQNHFTFHRRHTALQTISSRFTVKTKCLLLCVPLTLLLSLQYIYVA